MTGAAIGIKLRPDIRLPLRNIARGNGVCHHLWSTLRVVADVLGRLGHVQRRLQRCDGALKVDCRVRFMLVAAAAIIAGLAGLQAVPASHVDKFEAVLTVNQVKFERCASRNPRLKGLGSAV